MKINKKCQQGRIKNCIEAPSPDSGATRPGKMVVQHQTRNREAKNELNYLKIRHQPLPPWTNPKCAQQVIGVHYHVHGSVGDERHGEKRLRGGEPEVTHYDNHGVVVHVKEGEATGAGFTEKDQKSVDEFEDFGEVEDVGPEEGGALRRGACGGEADGPGVVIGWHLVECGESTAEGHEEGEEAED
ncbi:Uncharacterized protein Adt_26658 [Abeliophyllum distichum]|uniref:Uncharacterized protein n=1 Tax=Abeliophyllum distichum TaxID=126358 RepID=A0ABD1RRJ0_9LAMI